ncbi:UDP:flavonoid glycosyltransferase YjiC (YdhE family) [Micromonospora luteifusca]|uniref:UDP:flavonoid glycosyltransferase YjiC (YdhE family) n=1 Tax=Micromonospora luteifusca TaxID=709860 RepID=A0ABS2LXD1_9ACTN|nr:glycosyltransferase [Micromonospora luteifusca]MBM7492827.1 UDP:flavonoid glycosyltransferase YjiC (YdhE family) [Micromonospora luteifusca]
MRVLFASLAAVGHTYPLIPLAMAARDAGHEVHFAAGPAVHAPLAANGLRPFRPGDAFYEVYAEDLEPELARLRPDLVVHEWGLPGAAIAARQAGIPGIWHGFGRMFPDGIGLELPTRVASSRSGSTGTRNAEATGRPHVDICPPSLQDKDFLATERRIELRPVPFSTPSPLPEWASRRTSRPLVYLTLGTAFGTPELLSTAIAGLATLDAQVVVAAGRVPLDQLGALPDNVRAYPLVPQAELLPHVDVVVHHGGSGTTLGALAVGAPQLMLPQGADQFANAEAVSAAGAALRLLPEEVDADAVAEHTRRLLPRHGAAHRDAARAIAEEIDGMPSPAAVARRLPEYARAG